MRKVLGDTAASQKVLKVDHLSAVPLILACPGDFSIVGFNDIPTAKYMLPPLTTMRLYMDFMGEKAVDIIVERIQNKREIPMQIILPAKLMIRESVRTISEEISICATT